MQSGKNLTTAEILADRDGLITDRAAAAVDLASAEQQFKVAEATEQRIEARTANAILGHSHRLSPAEVELAEGSLAAIRAERTRIAAALAAAEGRLADLTTKAGTLAASEAFAADAMGLGLPLNMNNLERLAAERRGVTVALERLTAQAAQHRADLDALREREKEARQNLRCYRAICARLEEDAFYAQPWPRWSGPQS